MIECTIELLGKLYSANAQKKKVETRSDVETLRENQIIISPMCVLFFLNKIEANWSNCHSHTTTDTALTFTHKQTKSMTTKINLSRKFFLPDKKRQIEHIKPK